VADVCRPFGCVASAFRRKIQPSHTPPFPGAAGWAGVAAAASRDACERQMSGAQMRRWSRGSYADHTGRTRREESLRPLSGFALRRLAPRAPAGQHRHPARGSWVADMCRPFGCVASAFRRKIQPSHTPPFPGAAGWAGVAAAASTDACGRQMSGAQMRRWSRGSYADHTGRTRREESAAAIFRLRLASPRSKGLGRPAPALRARQLEATCQ
jgi:hypothetical protein